MAPSADLRGLRGFRGLRGGSDADLRGLRRVHRILRQHAGAAGATGATALKSMVLATWKKRKNARCLDHFPTKTTKFAISVSVYPLGLGTSQTCDPSTGEDEVGTHDQPGC